MYKQTIGAVIAFIFRSLLIFEGSPTLFLCFFHPFLSPLLCSLPSHSVAGARCQLDGTARARLVFRGRAVPGPGAVRGGDGAASVAAGAAPAALPALAAARAACRRLHGDLAAGAPGAAVRRARRETVHRAGQGGREAAVDGGRGGYVPLYVVLVRDRSSGR